MESQGATKEAKTENWWQVKKPYQVFMEIHEFLTGPSCSHKDPRWVPILNPELEGDIWNYENYRRVYRVQILDLGHFRWDYYTAKDIPFQPQSVGCRKEMCMA
jgi:hypothetical protein